jgi:hypothetical protein
MTPDSIWKREIGVIMVTGLSVHERGLEMASGKRKEGLVDLVPVICFLYDTPRPDSSRCGTDHRNDCDQRTLEDDNV